MSMGITQMNSLFSSINSMKNVNNLNSTKTLMNGRSRTIASEIKMDKGRGIDTKEKEELAEMKERILDVDEKVSGSLTELNERIESDREKIRKEEAELARQAEKAANSKTESPSDNNSKITDNKDTLVSGIDDAADTSENSVETNTAVSTAAIDFDASPVFYQATGKILDKKV